MLHFFTNHTLGALSFSDNCLGVLGICRYNGARELTIIQPYNEGYILAF